MSSALDSTFGATYIGVIVATFLYGIMTLQTYIYWIRYIHDSTFDRLFVVGLWMLDTFQLICVSHMQYHYVINNYANPIALQYNNWSFNMEVPLTTIITFLVQGFFARRAWHFTKRIGSTPTTTRRNKSLGVIIGFLSLCQLGFGMSASGLVWVLNEFSEFKKYNWVVGGWLGSAAAADLVIVYMLSRALMSQRTGFGRTDALINKLLRYTINTGLLTSIIAVVDVITFCTMNNLIHLGFNFTLGKLYTNTLLATLNSRPIEPEHVVHVESGSYRLGEVKRSAKSRSSTVQFDRPIGIFSQTVDGIHLHVDTQVEVTDADNRHEHGKKMVVLGNRKYEEHDLDGANSVESTKRSRVL